jgi:hypothetical protein
MVSIQERVEEASSALRDFSHLGVDAVPLLPRQLRQAVPLRQRRQAPKPPHRRLHLQAGMMTDIWKIEICWCCRFGGYVGGRIVPIRRSLTSSI